ncbi:MAG: M23 family metallopeptidase [Candidatus Adiutrix sp.]
MPIKTSHRQGPLKAGQLLASKLKLCFKAFVFVLAALCLKAHPAQGEAVFSILPNTLDRGTAARIIAHDFSANQNLTADFNGQSLGFFPMGENMVALFAADVMLSPGHYPLTINWNGGEKIFQVQVRDRSYGERSINVPTSQTDLSKRDLDRVARECLVVTQALSPESSSPTRMWSGSWLMPVGGKVVSAFGRQTRINGVLNSRPHLGVDLSAAEGTPVKAPAAGVVLLADFHFFAGGSVYVDHGLGLITMYFHLAELNVSAGEKVRAGDILGLSGRTGRVTGPHLHYGLYLNGGRIDPINFHKLITFLPDRP